MRIGIWIYGGIGGGNFSQGCPHIVRLVEELSAHDEITIYSILPANEGFVPDGYSFRTVNKGVSFSKLRMLLLALMFLYDHLRKRYDVLHAFWAYPAGTLAVVLGKITRVPSLVALQGGEGAALPSIGYGNMLHGFSRRMTLWTCEKASVLISISQYLTDKMYEYGLTRRDVILIPFGADTKTFTATEKKSSEVLKIIHVGNLNLVKDQHTLLRAFALIVKEQRAELRIVGDGVMGDNLRLVAQELGIGQYVIFEGAVPNAELSAYYGWADMMLHTSLYEGQAVVIGEALASKVVICGTRVGMMADLADVCCSVSEVGDYSGIAKNALTLWNDQALFTKVREAGYSWAMQHTIYWSVERTLAVYHEWERSNLRGL